MTFLEQDYRNFGRYGQKIKFTTTWLSSTFQNFSNIVKISLILSEYHNKKKQWSPPRGSSGHAYKEGDSSCKKTHNSGILQQTISSTQTLEKVETSNRFEYFKQSFECTNFQNENSRIDSTGGGGHLNRPNRH